MFRNARDAAIASDAAVVSDELGAVFVEYAVVLTLVSVGVVAAIAGLGAPLLNLFYYQQAVLLLPLP